MTMREAQTSHRCIRDGRARPTFPSNSRPLTQASGNWHRLSERRSVRYVLSQAPPLSARDRRRDLRRHFSSTFAPTSSSFALIFSASSFGAASLTGFGALSTSALASFRPSVVNSRTTLMT